MNFTYKFITMDLNPYVITYRSKSVCNYLRILHTDLLHMNFIYGSKSICNLPTNSSIDNINN